MPNPAFPDEAAQLLRERFGLQEFPPEGPVVPREILVDLAKAVKEELHYRSFLYCSASHWPASGEEGEHFMVAYAARRLGPGSTFLPFRVKVPADEPTPSLAGIWVGADWEEREQQDLLGVTFEGHPDPRRLMMPEDWEGHPLRKDYAIDTPHFPWR